MGRNRRLARISDSDDEDGEFRTEQFEKPPSPATTTNKRKKIVEESEPEESEPEEEEPEDEPVDAKPIGEPIKVSGKGRTKRSHYKAFEYDGNRFELEDSVLLTPEEPGQKPYVAIIKDITQDKDDSMMVLGQWFYRPEEAERKGSGKWEGKDTRELFYSFHRDEVPAESVMHKCQAHFIPLSKQIPDRSVHPGFIIQKVYDTVEKKLWKLTDKDYEDGKQHEIDLLVQKTVKLLGEIPDLVETEDIVVDAEDHIKDRRGLKRKDIPPIDVSRDTNIRHEHPPADTPGNSEMYRILANFKVLTGESIRDRWLEKLLEAMKWVSSSNENVQGGDNVKVDAAEVKDEGKICWPDAAVIAVVSLEKAAHDTLDAQKFNQKMRQMAFNLKSNSRLARRLINGELEASVVLNMSPNELKDGLTLEESTPKEPEEAPRMQMTDARCQRCQEKKMGLTDIIQAGSRGDRYQLECIACGFIWFAFRDDISTLTIDEPSVVGNVGAAPLATSKFEDAKKASPREVDKQPPNIFHPNLSVKKPKTEDPPVSTQMKTD